MSTHVRHTVRRLRARLTYANVMSTLAVVLVLGTGTAYAAGSIGSSQVSDNSLRSVDIRNDNLTGTDVRNGTLGAGELSATARNQVLPVASFTGGGGSIIDTDANDGLQQLISGEVMGGRRYLLVFAGEASNSSASPVDLVCKLTIDGDNVGTAIDTTVGATDVDGEESIAITGVREGFSADTPVALACVASDAGVIEVSGTVSAIETEMLP